MRTVVDKNKETNQQVVKLANNGITLGYNVEHMNLAPGTKGYVEGTFPNIAEARRFAKINLQVAEKLTKPKSAYPEQQTGYSRPASSMRSRRR